MEVKSAKNYTTTSLGTFRKKFTGKIDLSYIVHPKPFSFSDEDKLIKLPPYMIFCLQQNTHFFERIPLRGRAIRGSALSCSILPLRYRTPQAPLLSLEQWFTSYGCCGQLILYPFINSTHFSFMHSQSFRYLLITYLADFSNICSRSSFLFLF